MNEAPFRVDEIHARAESIECIYECRDFRGLELKHPANQDGTPDVRSDQPHLPARPVIDNAVSLVAEHSEYGRADCSPVENGAYEIDEALRLRPLTIYFGLGEFFKRYQIGDRNRLLDVSEKERLCGWINRFKQSDRRPLKSEIMWHSGVAGANILANKPGCGTADEIGRPFDSALPKRGIDGSIVDEADQIAQLLPIIGAACRRNS